MQLGIFAKTFLVPSRLRCSPKQRLRDMVLFSTIWLAPPSIASSGHHGGAASGLRAASAASGVAINAISATANLIHPDRAQRERGLKSSRPSCGMQKRWGDAVTLCSGTRDATDPWRWHQDNASPQAWADLCASLERLLPVADETGVSLGLNRNMPTSLQMQRRQRN